MRKLNLKARNRWLRVPAIIFFFAPLATIANDGKHTTYVNREFQFSVQVPFHAPTCRAEPDTQDTGIVIFLDRGPSDCAGRDQREYVAIIGNYNSVLDRTPFEILSRLCELSKPQTTDAHVFGNAIAKKWPAMCRDEQKDGFVFTHLAAQGWAADVVGEPPAINYAAYLNSRKSSYEQNIKKFKAILSTVRKHR